jgi:hypothetical protein
MSGIVVFFTRTALGGVPDMMSRIAGRSRTARNAIFRNYATGVIQQPKAARCRYEVDRALRDDGVVRLLLTVAIL